MFFLFLFFLFFLFFCFRGTRPSAHLRQPSLQQPSSLSREITDIVITLRRANVTMRRADVPGASSSTRSVVIASFIDPPDPATRVPACGETALAHTSWRSHGERHVAPQCCTVAAAGLSLPQTRSGAPTALCRDTTVTPTRPGTATPHDARQVTASENYVGKTTSPNRPRITLCATVRAMAAARPGLAPGYRYGQLRPGRPCTLPARQAGPA